jgi:hypothetical protein
VCQPLESDCVDPITNLRGTVDCVERVFGASFEFCQVLEGVVRREHQQLAADSMTKRGNSVCFTGNRIILSSLYRQGEAGIVQCPPVILKEGTIVGRLSLGQGVVQIQKPGVVGFVEPLDDTGRKTRAVLCGLRGDFQARFSMAAYKATRRGSRQRNPRQGCGAKWPPQTTPPRPRSGPCSSLRDHGCP